MHEIFLSTSLDELNALLQTLMHLECWRINSSGTNSLYLNIGDTYVTSIYTKKRGEIELKFGEWVIDSMGSAVRILLNESILFAAEKDESIYSDDLVQVQLMEAIQIERISALEDFSLGVQFSNGFVLEVSCEDYEDDPEYPCWEIYNSQHDMFLEVNSGRWSYRNIANRRY